MKRFAPLLALLAVLTMAIPAHAKAASPKGKAPLMSENFQAGFDLGIYFFSAIPYSSVEYKKDGKTGKATINGNGGVGFPIIGAHFNMLAAEKYIIHLDVAYGYQPGVATYKYEKFENKTLSDKQINFSMQTYRASVGIGKSIINTAYVKPYWMLGISLEELIFDDERGHNGTNQNASGTGLGGWGALGVDVKIVHTKGITFFAGGQFRVDIMYTVTPLIRSKPDSSITMAYIPISMILSGGIQF